MEITERISVSGATNEEIVELEFRLGVQLPTDYQRFLREQNGGRPSPKAFEGPTGDGSIVHFFFTLNRQSPHYWIHEELDTYEQRVPPHLLPIASDDFGNLVLLDLGAKSVGAIHFWDHENENLDGDPWWDNIAFIAPSFTDFVNGLR